MKMLRAHLVWGIIAPLVGVTFVQYGAKFGLIFLPKYYGIDPSFMDSVGIILLSTMLLGIIYKYCAVVSEKEI